MKSALMILIVVIVSGCVPKVPPVTVAQPPICKTQSYELWRADVLKKNQGVPLIESYMQGDKLQEFVAAYNATPPKTNKQPAAVAVWIHKVMLSAYLSKKRTGTTAPTALVVWVNGDGCLTETEIIPLMVMDKLLSGVPFTGRDQSY